MEREPLVYWRENKWARWMLIGFSLFWILLTCAETLAGGPLATMSRWQWAAQSQLWLVIWPWVVGGTTIVNGYFVTEGVLVVSQALLTVRRIPLAGVELTVQGKRCRLRWRHKTIHHSLDAKLPDSFVRGLEERIADARAAAPGAVPTTGVEADRVVSLAVLRRRGTTKAEMAVAAGVVLIYGLTIWFRQPFLLFLLLVLGWRQDLVDRQAVLLLAGDSLWLARRDQPLQVIPLAEVEAVEPVKRNQYRIKTAREVGFPLLLGTPLHKELIQALEQRLAGAPQPSFGGAAGAAESGLRCAICGRTAPGLGPEPGVAVDAAYICPACSDRARYEAGQSGHGLTGKEPKPM